MNNDKSAQTRFKNTQANAARAALGSNLAAQASVKNKFPVRKFRPTGQAIGSGVSNNTQSVQPEVNPVAAPPGFNPLYPKAPELPQASAASEGNAVLSGLVQQIHGSKLVDSQDMRAAYMQSKFRDYFHDKDDSNNTASDVLNRLSSDK